MQNTSRRDFVKQATAGASAAALARRVIAQTSAAAGTGVPTRELGRTGQRVSIACLGGWHVGAIKDEAEAIRVMHAAIDEGINFFDNAWDYHDGHAEEIMGKALAMDSRRNKVFLMTKNCNRDYKGSMQCLEDSLRRLKTDHLDLWQFHELVYDNDPDWIFEKGGIKAALEARKAGKVRFIGFTDAHQHHGRAVPKFSGRGDPGVPEEKCGGDRHEGTGGRLSARSPANQGRAQRG